MNAQYWNTRYAGGYGTGNGSKGRLKEFKLQSVQKIVDDYAVKSVVDVGCGDGSQLAGLKVAEYRGLDISDVAIGQASKLTNEHRIYSTMDEDAIAKSKVAELAVSLDVVSHLTDDEVFEAHIRLLFHLASKYVLIYGPNRTGEGLQLARHMKFREFVLWIEKNIKGAELIHEIPNRYPPALRGNRFAGDTSFCDFYLFHMEQSRSKKVANPNVERVDGPEGETE